MSPAQIGKSEQTCPSAGRLVGWRNFVDSTRNDENIHDIGGRRFPVVVVVVVVVVAVVVIVGAVLCCPSPTDSPLLESPLTHDKSIIDRETVDLIDAECLQLVVLLLVSRKMRGGACRREGTGQRKQNDALSLEEVLGGQVLPVKRVLVIALDARARLEDDARNDLALLDGRLPLSLDWL